MTENQDCISVSENQHCISVSENQDCISVSENQDCISVTDNQDCISVTEVLTTWAEFIIRDHSQAGGCFSVEWSQIEGTGHYLSSEGGRGGGRGGRGEGDEEVRR